MVEGNVSKNNFLAVVRIRGSIGVRRDIELALKQLGLTRKNHCVLVKKENENMVKKVGDYVTWGEVDDETIALLDKVRVLQSGGKNRKTEKSERVEQASGKSKKVFRLQPPRKGFKGGVKKRFPKGAVGYRGKAINDLIKAMLPINVK